MNLNDIKAEAREELSEQLNEHMMTNLEIEIGSTLYVALLDFIEEKQEAVRKETLEEAAALAEKIKASEAKAIMQESIKDIQTKAKNKLLHWSFKKGIFSESVAKELVNQVIAETAEATYRECAEIAMQHGEGKDHSPESCGTTIAKEIEDKANSLSKSDE